jgi:hypothetical protein
MLENREISEVFGRQKRTPGRLGKACGHNPSAYATEKSDTNIVPEKEPNKAGFPKTAAEVPEGRAVTKGKFWKDRLRPVRSGRSKH